jgi:hypothetical protein
MSHIRDLNYIFCIIFWCEFVQDNGANCIDATSGTTMEMQLADPVQEHSDSVSQSQTVSIYVRDLHLNSCTTAGLITL